MVESNPQPPAKKGKGAPKDKPVDLAVKYKRKDVENLMKRKFFVVPSFEIYGGVAGFFDYGPLGSALKQNVEEKWRKHFVLEEDMLEVTTTNLIAYDVLKTSGHVDKFSDFMVRDAKTHQPRRADKLIQEVLQKMIAKSKKPEEIEKLRKIEMDAENYDAAQIDACISELKIRDPETGNELTPATPFNLMFENQIGPSGYMSGFLRPETAQGIFINFRRLIEFNNGRMPFAAAQIGMGFRNEISPRQGLLRVREFTMAEIEHFVDPQNKSHPKINTVADLKLPLYKAQDQEEGLLIANSDKTVREALDQGILQNETLAYFLARTYQFLLDVGINPSGIRFRQHRSNEMAHYANDCWDAEIETSYGWIEVAGHSDRSAFDLTKHQEKTKIELMAARPLKTPIQKQITHVVLDKQACGKEFKKDNAKVVGYFENLSADEKKEHAVKFAENGKTMVINAEGVEFSLTEKHLSFNEETVTIQEEKYIPHVIEPSFGVGRIVYSIFEHCFKVREKDAQRTYFDFPVHISPFKCSLLPLQNHAGLNQIVKDVKKLLIQHGITNKVDDSGQSIGKRYARTDECGIPYAITVDFDTINDQTVTLRQLDSMLQVRLPIADLPLCMNQLIAQTLTWQSVIEKYGLCDTSAQDAN